MSCNNFKKLQIRPFKLQISPMGNIASGQTCSHSKTLSYCYVSGKKNFWPLSNIRDRIPLKHIPLKYVSFLSRLASRETRHVSFLASALEVPILHFQTCFVYYMYRTDLRGRHDFHSHQQCVYTMCVL